MKISPTHINDVLIIEPQVFGDERGYFFESFKESELTNYLGYKINFCQDNESKSSFGVLRGLHYQLPPFAQTKLVRVIQGKVLDVAVDIRKDSPTFGQHVAVELTDENKKQLFIPRGFAHGFVVLSETTIFSYKVDNPYAPQHEDGIIWNDGGLNIDWILNASEVQLSGKDQSLGELKNLEIMF